MNIRPLNGDQALAYGALLSGVGLVTSYPGSPSSGTVETLISLAKDHAIYVEWSSNEKVAMEMGIGASMAGRRALVCVKSVGLNAMIDPLMALNLTPVNGGLVILLGDDPGAYGSQNDQDSRPLSILLEMPLMEPASPAEAFVMMQEAFDLSEKFGTAVIIRETRSFTQYVESLLLPDNYSFKPFQRDFVRETWRYTPVPKNVVAKHKNLHERMDALSTWAGRAKFNRLWGKGTKGLIGAGFAYKKLLDIFGEEEFDSFRLLKLGVLYPLPKDILDDILEGCEEILVIEENEPFVETALKALAYDLGHRTLIFGKQTGHVAREGELFRWQIQRALENFIPEFAPRKCYLEENEETERPKKVNDCAGCQYDKVLDCLSEAAKGLKANPVLIGDPGCLVTVADRLDAKYAMGSAIAVADGVSKAGCVERTVAILGDSSFYHTSIPAVCNAVHNGSDILIVVLDNQATAASGFQPNPGVGRNAMGHWAPALDIAKIARACGVRNVFKTRLEDGPAILTTEFRKALSLGELALMIVEIQNQK